MKYQYKQKLSINDLPKVCYSVQPMYQGQLDMGMEVPVIIVKKGHQGYWKTNATTKSMNNLMERNILDFGVSSVDVVKIMQDQSVSGHYGILEFYNNKVK